MRIAVVTPLFPIRAEPYRGLPIYQTVRALCKLADVHVYCISAVYLRFLRPSSYQYREADPTYQPPGVPTTYLGYFAIPRLTRVWNGRFCGRKLLAPLKAARPDVILSYWLYPEGFGAVWAGRRLGIPAIAGSRGSDLRRIPDSGTRRKVVEALSMASHLVTVSEELRGIAISMGMDGARVTSISNGCDGSIFFPAGRREARRALGLREDAEIVLSVGHLQASKGIWDLLDAVRPLLANRPRLQVVYVGEGTGGEELKRRIASDGLADRVKTPGAFPAREVARWMAACDVFCLPSHSEGCPNVVIEALACGRPVVGTAVGGVPELIDDSCGVLTPAQDPFRLSAAIETALDRSWRAEDLARFSRTWDDVARETLAVCERAIAEAGKR